MLPNAQPKGRPAIFDKRDLSREKDQRRRSVYLAVDRRDERACRCCGRREKLHHHHLIFRSRQGEDAPENILLLCAFCHALIHARQLWILGKNADRRLTFEVHEAAVVDLFGVKPVPRDVRIVTSGRFR